MKGLWYMTCLTGHWYGNRGYWGDPNLVNGTIFAVAENPEGPYKELKDNALLAARTTAPISCRSLEHEEARYILYTDREREDHTDSGGVTWGTLTTPKYLRTSGDRLFVSYSPRIESEVAETLIGPNQPPEIDSRKVWGQVWQMETARWMCGESISGEAETGWGVLRFAAAPESFIFDTTIILFSGEAAGVAFRLGEDIQGAVVVVEPSEQAVAYYELPSFEFSEKRLTPIPLNEAVHLRVVHRLEHIEVYVNDDLRLAFSRYRGIGGSTGLFVDRVKAVFEKTRLRSLDIRRPE